MVPRGILYCTGLRGHLSGAEDLPNLWAVLERRGWGEALLENLFCRNLEGFLGRLG